MTPIPNTFQTPNEYIDRAMQYLGCDELRVLLFATRHILGWKDRIDERTAKISLSRFVKGRGDGFGGCGISRPAIKNALDSLVTFGFLIKIGDAGNDGQEWKLGTEIDYPALEDRYAKEAEKKRQKVSKAAKASGEKRRKGGTTDVPASSTSHVPLEQYVPRTSSGTTDVPLGGTTDVPKQNQVTNTPSNTIKESAAPADKKANGFEVFEALVKALGYQQSDIGKTLKTQLFKIAHDLISSENPVKPEEVASLVTFAKRGEKDGKFSIWWITPKVGEWRKWQREQKTPSSSAAPSPTNGAKVETDYEREQRENMKRWAAIDAKKKAG